jgi:hypothetical protein
MAKYLYLNHGLHTGQINRYNKREYIDLALPSQCFRNGKTLQRKAVMQIWQELQAF